MADLHPQIACDQEEGGLHKGMIQDMEHRSDESQGIGHPQTQPDISDLCDAAIGQHPFEFLLGQGHERPVEDSSRREPGDYGGDGHPLLYLGGGRRQRIELE